MPKVLKAGDIVRDQEGMFGQEHNRILKRISPRLKRIEAFILEELETRRMSMLPVHNGGGGKGDGDGDSTCIDSAYQALKDIRAVIKAVRI